MDIFLQQVANGIVIGIGYALAAAGLTLVFGILGILNFAHGELFMLGAYGVLLAMEHFGLGYGFSMLASVVGVVAVGMLLKWSVVDPLLKIDAINTLLGTFALSLLLHYTVALGAGFSPQRIVSPFSNIVELGPVVLTGQKLLVLIAGGALLIAVGAMLKMTSVGRLMRGTAQNRRAALLLGVNVQSVENLTFALGTGLAAFGGALLGPVSPVSPGMGGSIVVKAFAVIVLGGVGSLPGAVVAGLMLGVGEALAAGYVSSAWRDGLAYVLLLLVLLVLPGGLFGVRRVR